MNRNLRHMACAGKTFFFASLWLPKSVREDAAVAYSFCRAVDDIADDPQGTERASLGLIATAIEERDLSVPIVQGVLQLLDRHPEIEAPLIKLVRSCAGDTASIRIETEEDLLRYCEGVAGTVGLVMYPILGGTESAGRVYAEALGVAMQCTNIARDIFADLENGRIYLPGTWLNGSDLVDLLSCGAEGDAVVSGAVERLLEFSAERYAFGLTGLRYLGPECRRGIEIAARCYAAIGGRVFDNGRLARRRAVVPLLQKFRIATRVFLNPARVGRGELAFSK